MSTDSPSLIPIDGSHYNIAIVGSRFNSELVNGLIERAIATLKAAGVKQEGIRVARVPGANELPYVASLLASSEQYECIIALGVVIAGATSHHDVIAQSTATALHSIGFQYRVPVINGIVVANSLAEAEERTIGAIDRGAEFARAALEMAQLNEGLGELIDEELLGLADLMTAEEAGGDNEIEDIFK